ncbi:hypothetical protein Micbo1qcDRAFT_125258 [Microdochium bolleyi]|uniref:Calpain catalytic domain-containing protein n=1 Tax=Microdochium bolleyi TaxID=196109 RepID=A0A136IQI6_9PEZI|nr:hypothetical protein Micbo1qcDRAFT_125258 [Microdochium bolleyi]
MDNIQFASSESSSKNSKLLVVDPSALVEAILGHKANKQMSPGSDSLQSDYDELGDVRPVSLLSSGGRSLHADPPPKDVRVGAVNPYALAEALLGRKIEARTMVSAKILASVLQTEYDELFDMKHDSVLFAGLKLNKKDRKAEKLTEKDMKILNEHDLETPDLSEVKQLKDLEKIGLKDMGEARVKMARMQNGKLRLVIDAHSLGKTVTNRAVTMTVNELVTPFRMQKGHWMPPNGSWRDMYDYYFQVFRKRVIGDLAMFQIVDGNTMHSFDDPIQGCTSNSWLIAALFSVFWSDPAAINRSTRVHQNNDEKKRLVVKFHDKGGDNNARTDTVEVNYEIPMNNSNSEPLYCRSSDGADIWPSLYEKAFAKWITGSSSQQPDITQTHSGDPIKAMAQINGRETHYYITEKHSANDLLGLVRSNCVNLKTINPMTAWTYATGDVYTGSNIVANHAYSVLGFTILGRKQYIILRNPWGVTEPTGLTSYPGLLERLDPITWYPASMLDHGGLFGLEAKAFKECFAYIGTAK